MASDPPQGTRFYWHWSYFMKMQETTNHCIVYDGGGVHDHYLLHEGSGLA